MQQSEAETRSMIVSDKPTSRYQFTLVCEWLWRRFQQR